MNFRWARRMVIRIALCLALLATSAPAAEITTTDCDLPWSALFDLDPAQIEVAGPINTEFCEAAQLYVVLVYTVRDGESQLIIPESGIIVAVFDSSGTLLTESDTTGAFFAPVGSYFVEIENIGGQKKRISLYGDFVPAGLNLPTPDPDEDTRRRLVRRS